MLIFSSDVPEMQDMIYIYMICLERLGVLVDLSCNKKLN